MVLSPGVVVTPPGVVVTPPGVVLVADIMPARTVSFHLFHTIITNVESQNKIAKNAIVDNRSKPFQ